MVTVAPAQPFSQCLILECYFSDPLPNKSTQSVATGSAFLGSLIAESAVAKGMSATIHPNFNNSGGGQKLSCYQLTSVIS